MIVARAAAPACLAALMALVTPSPHAETLSANPAHSGSEAPKQAGLKDLYESALALNPEFKAMALRLDSLAARRKSAESITLEAPTVEAAVRSDQGLEDNGQQEFEIGFSAPLWLWNEQDLTLALRDQEAAQARARLGLIQLEVAGKVRQSAWALLIARLDHDAALARAQAANKLVGDVARRVEAGELAKTDLYEAQALATQAVAQAEQARGLLAGQSAQFEVNTGLPANQLVALPPEGDLLTLDFPVQDHPAYRMALSRLEVATSQAELTRTQRRSNPELSLSLIRERPGFGMSHEESVRLGTRIPLGRSAEYQGRIQEAMADVTEAQLALERVETQLRVEVRAAGQIAKAFADSSQAALEQARLAEQTHQLFQKSFDLGETDLPTLLRVEQQAFIAHRQALRSSLDYAARVSDLRQAMGLLPNLQTQP